MNNCCQNELALEKLCCCCADIKKIVVNNICGQAAEFKNISAENEVVNNICVSGIAQASQAQVDQGFFNALCAQNATMDNACISNLKVGVLESVEQYRAAVSLSSNMVYTLGSNLNWDTIVDDPNSNVSLSPFSYTVPVSGYYVFSYYLRSDSLSGSSVVAGAPIGLLDVTVNGADLRLLQVPYLTFSALQSGELSALVLLNAGDVIRMNYNVLILDPVSGLIPYVGTVSVKGGATPGFSQFTIHYLSSLSGSAVTCPPCPAITVGCKEFVTPCSPIGCDDNRGQQQQCKPCVMPQSKPISMPQYPAAKPAAAIFVNNKVQSRK